MKTHCLQLRDGVALEIDVDVDRSAADTRSLGVVSRSGAVFAVAEVWVRIGDDRHLVSGQFNTGNAIGFLERASKALLSAAPLPDQAKIFGGVGPCRWLLRYWENIDAEVATPDDEALYDALLPYCAINEGNGCISIYVSNAATVLQVCARDSTLLAPLCYEIDVVPSTIVPEIELICSRVREDVIARLSLL